MIIRLKILFHVFDDTGLNGLENGIESPFGDEVHFIFLNRLLHDINDKMVVF